MSRDANDSPPREKVVVTKIWTGWKASKPHSPVLELRARATAMRFGENVDGTMSTGSTGAHTVTGISVWRRRPRVT